METKANSWPGSIFIKHHLEVGPQNRGLVQSVSGITPYLIFSGDRKLNPDLQSHSVWSAL